MQCQCPQNQYIYVYSLIVNVGLLGLLPGPNSDQHVG